MLNTVGIFNNKIALSAFLISAIFIVLGMSACSDKSLSIEDEQATLNNQLTGVNFKAGSNKYSKDPVVQKAEEAFIELSKEIPGFAGYYLERKNTNETANLVTLVKDAENIAATKQTVRSYVNKRYQQRNLQFSASQIDLKNADYSYEELSDWRDILIWPVFDIEGVTMVDLSEDINRLTVGVKNSAVSANVESVIKSLEIPREALNIKITGKIELLNEKEAYKSERNIQLGLLDLSDRVRPLAGGLGIFIDRVNKPNTFCTYGFNAIWNGMDVFVTNSHCTSVSWGSDSGTNFYQPSSGPNNFIGNEIFDPNSFECGFLNINDCRYSDASLIELDENVTGELGTIVKTNGLGINWSSGSKKIIQPRFEIISDNKELLVNMPLTKVGRSSGWTLGYVDGTCVTADWQLPNSQIFCQTTVDGMYAEGGDSGSPVFYINTTPENQAELVGILWGANDTEEISVFSPMDNVRTDLADQYSLTTFNPTLQVAISGRGFVDQAGVYNWSANVQNQSSSVSYQWSIQYEGSPGWANLGTVSNQSVNITNDTDFILRLIVTDATDSDTAFKPVNVNLAGCTPSEPCGN